MFMSLSEIVSQLHASSIWVARLAECYSVFQCFQEIPGFQSFAQHFLDPFPGFVCEFWGVLVQAHSAQVFIQRGH